MELKPVYLLVKDLFFAGKVVKTAQTMGLQARAFDHSERLMEAARQKEPALVMMDAEGCEKEAFQLLKIFRSDKTLSRVPCVGYLSHAAQELKREMRSAGCEQVYAKSEFVKELENLLMRYAHGIPSRL